MLAFSIGPIANGLLTFTALPLVAWLFASEQIGRIAVLSATTELFVLLCSLGADQVYVRNFHETPNTERLFRQATLLPLSVAVVAWIVGATVGAAPLSRAMFGLGSYSAGLLAATYFLCSLASFFLVLPLRMAGRGYQYSLGQSIGRLGFLVAAGAVVLTDVTRSFQALLVITVVGVAIGVVVQAILVLPTLVLAVRSRTGENGDTPAAAGGSYGTWQARLRFGVPLSIGGVSYWLMFLSDRFILRKTSTFSELGRYSVALTIAAGVTLLTGIVGTLWSPWVFRSLADGSDAPDMRRHREVAGHLLAGALVLVCVTGLFGGIVEWFLPNQYDGLRLLMPACVVAPLLYMLVDVNSIGITVARKTNLTMWSSIAVGLFCVAISVVLIPRYGARGAAVATAISYWVWLVVRTELSIRVWQHVPRADLYPFSATVTGWACVHAWLATTTGTVISTLGWIVLLAAVLGRFHRSARAAIDIVSRALDRRRRQPARRNP